MNALNLKLYNLLKNDLKLPDAKAEEFMQTLDSLIQEDIKNSTTEYQSIVKGDMLKLEMNLRTEIKDTKVDTIKWMVGIFIGLALMIIGLYIKK